MSTRRQFIRIVPVVAATLLVARTAQAAMLDEGDAQARALGYVADAARADKAKYKQFAPGQRCNLCSLFDGKSSDAAANCKLFPGKQVAGSGWCSAWTKKA